MMKTQCEVCRERVVYVFCTTEDMALCSLCDTAHHRAAANHHRLPFFYPHPKPLPICDTCQETKAFIFCIEHRAILCRSCDMSLHSKDDFKKQHRRFLHSGAQFQYDETRISSSTDFNSSGISTSTTPSAPQPQPQPHASNDPYGFYKKDQDSSFTFSDTDLGSYLCSLSPKSP